VGAQARMAKDDQQPCSRQGLEQTPMWPRRSQRCPHLGLGPLASWVWHGEFFCVGPQFMTLG
jgi:hypothetical protein